MLVSSLGGGEIPKYLVHCGCLELRGLAYDFGVYDSIDRGSDGPS